MNDGMNQTLSSCRDANQFLYQPPSWDAKIELIKHLVLGGHNVLISVLGGSGGGKSTFSTLLCSHLEKKVQSVSLSATPSFDRSEFIRSLHTAFKLEGDCTLENCIRQIQTHQIQTLLIVDDAQYLSQDFVQEVVQGLQQQGAPSYFHICLISDFTMAPLFKTLARDNCQDMIHTIELGNLTEKETTNYVYQRFLAQSGRFDRERLKQFYERTRGELVEVNAQLDHFFSPETPTKKNSAQHKKPVRRAVMMGAVILGAVGLGFSLKPQTHQRSDAIESVVEAVAALTPVEAPMLTSRLPAYNDGAMRRKLQPAFIQQVDLDGLQNMEEDPPASSLVVMDKVLVIPKVIQTSVEKKQVASDSQESQSSAQAIGDALAAAPDRSVGFGSPENAARPREAVVSAESQRAALPKQAVKQSLQPNVHALPIAQTHYTVQLLAGQRLEALRYFIKLHQLEGQAQIFKTQKQGRNWYVLTLGDLGFQENAKRKAEQLPAHLTKITPWVRPLSGLESVG